MAEQLEAGPMTVKKQTVSEVHSGGALTSGAGGCRAAEPVFEDLHEMRVRKVWASQGANPKSSHLIDSHACEPPYLATPLRPLEGPKRGLTGPKTWQII